jgi:hypothetical protein
MEFAEFPGSTGGSPVGDGGLAVANFSGLDSSRKMVAASRRNPQAGRLRSPEFWIPPQGELL